jgi:hypothetical protein
MTREKIREVAVKALTIVVGLIGLVVFGPWIPGTGEGFVVWLGLLAAVFIVGGIIVIVQFPKHKGYWPSRWSDGQLSEDYRPPIDPHDKPLT